MMVDNTFGSVVNRLARRFTFYLCFLLQHTDSNYLHFLCLVINNISALDFSRINHIISSNDSEYTNHENKKNKRGTQI